MTTRVLASTTSHKREPLAETLEAFARLGLREIDLNLFPAIEGGVPIDAVEQGLAAHGLQVVVASGGWCDFFQTAPSAAATTSSVDRQVALARRLGTGMLRLFFGRLLRADYGEASHALIVSNLRQLSDRHPDMTFAFENHDGASLVPAICGAVLEAVDRPNIRMTFDPINFERAGVGAAAALAAVRTFVAHVHLKGLDRGALCEFGAGDVDLTGVLQSLVDSGYSGRFTVEYERPFDAMAHLYRGVEHARRVLERLGAGAGGRP
ncbi:MAG TPA: sugar phosphate isomerase/epimerase [Vicinamibacterales bacterium]|nr:sugar phosphate isomerase/epimerase [Vicinamibacterales bacterium]